MEGMNVGSLLTLRPSFHSHLSFLSLPLGLAFKVNSPPLLLHPTLLLQFFSSPPLFFSSLDTRSLALDSAGYFQPFCHYQNHRAYNHEPSSPTSPPTHRFSPFLRLAFPDNNTKTFQSGHVILSALVPLLFDCSRSGRCAEWRSTSLPLPVRNHISGQLP